MPVAAVMAVAAIVASRQQSNAQKRAERAQKSGQQSALAAVTAGALQARSDAIPLFESGLQNRLQGFQGALDIFAQSIPGQIEAFQGGNLNAQNTLLAGLDPQIAAILGGNVNLSGLQAQQTQAPQFSAFQQELPEFQRITDVVGRPRGFAPLGPSARQRPGFFPSGLADIDALGD